jgi:tetratricopeptide (TPR) repeat protein
LLALDRVDEAYDALHKASWSFNTIPAAMVLIAAIDGRRGDFEAMKSHALTALAQQRLHPIAGPYAAIADWKLGNSDQALARLDAINAEDKLNHLARFLRVTVAGEPLDGFYDPHQLNSNPSQTVLDLAFDLLDAGLADLAIEALDGLEMHRGASASARYVLAAIHKAGGNESAAANARRSAQQGREVDVFPYRAGELKALLAAIEDDPTDAMANYLLGCILYDKRRHHEAASAWERAIANDPDFYIPYRNLAVAYYSKLGRRHEALGLLKKALELKPGDDLLLKETAYLMARLGVPPAEQVVFLRDNCPAKPSDNLTLYYAQALLTAGQFEDAANLLESHNFTPAERSEMFLTEAYTFANAALGRLARQSSDLESALHFYRQAQSEPPGFFAGWWDLQALYYARYYEAEALDELGRIAERDQVLAELTTYIVSDYSPYMPPDRFCFIAAAMRLGGDEIGARVLMGDKVREWTAGLDSDVDRKPVATAQYISYLDDPALVRRAALLGALGFAELFFGDRDKAGQLFTDSLSLDPDNPRIRFELTAILGQEAPELRFDNRNDH